MKSSIRYLLLLVFSLTIISTIGLLSGGYGKHALINAGYVTRFAWDKAPKPFNIKTHFYGRNLTDAENCQLNGWKKNSGDQKVFDAILFSVELDLLEIRLKELYDVVDKFLILESNSTFTGLPKEYVFDKYRDRFAFAKDKIVYKQALMRPLEKGEDPFVLEGMHRGAMNSLFKEAGVEDGDWILMMDVDEIPSAHTVQLFKSCEGIPSPLHLQLRNYMYSFEFLLDMNSWRGKAIKYPANYGHARSSDDMLADSGWHCSFCFRDLQDFQFKMQGYSHADRVHSKKMLDLNRIQTVICEGTDIFDMVPEAYSFKELVTKWGKIPKQTSAIELPTALLKDPIKFSFLLPGGSMNEYERKRQEKIRQNQEYLKMLGLAVESPVLETENNQIEKENKKPRTVAKKQKIATRAPVARRTSLRIRGADPNGEEAKNAKQAAALKEKEELAARARVQGAIPAVDEDEKDKIEFLQSISNLNTKPIDYSSTPGGDTNAFTSYRNQIAYNGSVKVVNEMIYSLEFHPSATKLLAFVGDKKGTLGIWDINDSLEKSLLNPDQEVTDPIVHSFKPFKRAVSKILHAPENLDKVYLSSHDGSIREFDIRAQTFNELYVHPDEDALGHVDFYSVQNMWFCTHRGQIGLIDARTAPKRAKFIFQASERKLNTIDINNLSPHYFCTAGLDHIIRVFDSRKLKEVDGLLESVSTYEHGKSANSAYWDPVNKNSVLSLSFDDTIAIWKNAPLTSGSVVNIKHNNQTGRWVQKFKAVHCPFAHDGQSVFVVGNMARKLEVFNGTTGKGLARFEDPNLLTSIPAVNAFHPNPACGIIASGNSSGRMNIWM